VNGSCVPLGPADAGRDSASDAAIDARRGTKRPGDACMSATDCASGDCCGARTPGAYSRYCAATCELKNPVGASCLGNSECISGTTCSEVESCTKACTTDADCGVNVFDSQLTPNHCAGSQCYPGCWGTQSSTCIFYTNPSTGAALHCTKA